VNDTAKVIQSAENLRIKSDNKAGSSSDLDYVQKQIGNMKISDGGVGRPTLVKNAALPEHPENVDLRSSAVRDGSLTFNNDGTVDKRCSAVRSSDVLVTVEGNVDGSLEYKNGMWLLL